MGNGHLDLGITGRDLAADSLAPVDEVLTLGFGASMFRYAAPANEEWTVGDLAGKRIATSYPNLVREDLKARGLEAEVIRLDGAVEISIRAWASPTPSPTWCPPAARCASRAWPGLGDSLCDSEAVVVGRRDNEVTDAQRVFLRRLTGILHAKNYMMLDYNIDAANLDEASRITPGLSGPTASPLANENWVAVRAMVPRDLANSLRTSCRPGAEAILASDIRIARI